MIHRECGATFASVLNGVHKIVCALASHHSTTGLIGFADGAVSLSLGKELDAALPAQCSAYSFRNQVATTMCKWA